MGLGLEVEGRQDGAEMQDEGHGEGRCLGNPCGLMEKRDKGSCVGKMSPNPCFLGESHHQHFSSSDGGAQGLPQLLGGWSLAWGGHWVEEVLITTSTESPKQDETSRLSAAAFDEHRSPPGANEGSGCLHRKHLGDFLPLGHKAILLTPAWLLQTYPLLKVTAFPKAARQPLTYLSEAQGAKKTLLFPAQLRPTVEQSILQQKMISQVILALVADTELPVPHGQLGLSISGLWGTPLGLGGRRHQ